MKRFPDTLVIMLGGILLAWIFTYIIPSGVFARITDPETGNTQVVAGSYKQIEADAPGVFDLLLAIPEGIIARADLIVLILLIGGSFYVIEKTGALGQGLQRVVDLLKGREVMALVLVSLLFAAAGATIGLQEEIIALAPILILFARSMGYDAFAALGISYGSAVLGAAFSPINPFAVVIAQEAAELPLLSGSGFRLVVLGLAFVLWTGAMVRYARNNRVPKKAIETEGNRLTPGSILILCLLVATFVWVTYGMLQWGWYFNELSAAFFGLGVVAGLVGKLGLNGTGRAFAAGFREMIFAGVVIGLAQSITILLENGKVIDSVVYGLFTPLQDLPQGISALGIYGAQALLHFPVPSYSGQAVLTLPVLTPLSDLIGISRQTCVLAYQYGAVNMDLIVPTNGALMGILAVAGISYDKWIRFIWKPVLLLFALGGAAIITAIQIGYA
ncbi:YfcC family protein [Robiginitalea biformata]|uniref:YcgA n=1 Tax=Robiginitalea biformata (strain ATCC BAA-864 / DSM 15991 / KCTC 12146 / HTCC2501) TaxID=313596 RepID=A4CM87_ROBBH|nr:Na+/H+ antiporter NhaC family protein [Robiginitalea biformata]EAR14779.1 YcgA [Robiginitalea biformata HTCC2501]